MLVWEWAQKPVTALIYIVLDVWKGTTSTSKSHLPPTVCLCVGVAPSTLHFVLQFYFILVLMALS
jgi:hypothetical protein